MGHKLMVISKRRDTGTIATSFIFGLHTGVLVTILFETFFESRNYNASALVSLGVTGLTTLYICAVLFFPWFSAPEMRPLRNLGLLFLGLTQMMIYFLTPHGDYGMITFASFDALFYILYTALPGMLPFKVEKEESFVMGGAPPATIVQQPSPMPGPVYSYGAPSAPAPSYQAPNVPIKN